jgi:hypothetical protein
VAKFNSFNKECLALGFEEEFQLLMRLNSPLEAFRVRGQEVTSAANVLAAVGVESTAEICEEVDGLST